MVLALLALKLQAAKLPTCNVVRVIRCWALTVLIVSIIIEEIMFPSEAVGILGQR